MAEEKKDQPQNPEPPKIKLNGNGKHPTDKLPTASQALPPKVKLDTAQIKMASAPALVPTAPASGESRKESTLRIDLPGSNITETAPPPLARKQTSRIEVPMTIAAASPGVAKKSTARIELPDTVVATSGLKKDTKKVQLPDTVVEIPAPSTVKKQTTPLTVKKQTARVDLGTTVIAMPAAQEAKKTTARIELGDAIGIGKPAPEPVAPGARQIPRTVRIKQPEMPPTISLKKPPMPVPVGTPTSAGEVRKSETARIELPPETIVEQPVTRRKTIRIKRPGAEGDEVPAPRPLTVAREPGESLQPPTLTGMKVPELEETDEPGITFTLCAIAALLIVSVLIYVLAAQTFAPNLPFPGKVV
ncbi:MAG: hypothetical protein NTY53_24185 [Kiritimatiellaeota bacterium]|nr:hypothetical protein [Kiritimatiellota bacterium]